MQNIAVLASMALLPLLGAQMKGTLNACQFLSSAEVSRVTGQRAGEPMPTGNPASCVWETAQLTILTDNPDQRIATMTTSFGRQGAKPVTIPGIGEQAFSFAPEPRDKYDDRVVYVVV